MAEGDGEQQKHSLDDEFGLGAVREVLRLISDTDITEIQIKRGDAELHIKRGNTQHPAPYMVTPSLAATLQPSISSPLPPIASFQQHAPGSEQPAPAPTEREQPSGQPITAPMVGTFYSAPSPKDTPFVQEGDTINPGDRIGIIETMKMMNEIESEIAGRITRILVHNGQPVEYGQPLMIVEPL
ncbi:MAG TPA: acetyl-CoA carboxylase biotin carboxyl carrier protein [Roseiflexaceae bacterium]|nr:acetyl-CoA carboxylase biotin carboxyl carrier protein [Roseiflexaceae bacterium]